MGMGDRECPKCGWEMYHDTDCTVCELRDKIKSAVEYFELLKFNIEDGQGVGKLLETINEALSEMKE